MALLEVRDLTVDFVSRRGTLRAVEDISFSVDRGEAVAVVGESGSGKSVMAKSIVRINPEPPGRVVKGEILLDGENVLEMSDRELRAVRGRRIGMIFQDPLSSLDPVFTIGMQIREALQGTSTERASHQQRAVQLLDEVRINNAAERMGQFPHQFSGGMRQRVVAAIALAGGCDLLIADEPTTALDVTVQAQFLQLLKSVQQERGLATLFITHDLGVVARLCSRIIVMYSGRIVETGTAHEIFHSPKHPYTKALLASIPRLGQKDRVMQGIAGQPPDPMNRPGGCLFHPRCELATDRCTTEPPPVVTGPSGRYAECWEVGSTL